MKNLIFNEFVIIFNNNLYCVWSKLQTNKSISTDRK